MRAAESVQSARSSTAAQYQYAPYKGVPQRLTSPHIECCRLPESGWTGWPLASCQHGICSGALEDSDEEETDWDQQLRFFHKRWRVDPDHKLRVGKQMLRLHKVVRGRRADASSLHAMRLALLLDHEDLLGSSYSR